MCQTIRLLFILNGILQYILKRGTDSFRIPDHIMTDKKLIFKPMETAQIIFFPGAALFPAKLTNTLAKHLKLAHKIVVCF